MKRPLHTKKARGFTLVELLIVISIIGVIAAIVMVALDQSRTKGRDGQRKSQTNEVLKALELYYSDNGTYPSHNDGTEGYLSGIDSSFYGMGTYIRRLPDTADSEYYYCVSSDLRSMLLAVDTEQDSGGSNFCNITRGPGPDYGCDPSFIIDAGGDDASDSCALRF
jgi:general secretion pathway protein G